MDGCRTGGVVLLRFCETETRFCMKTRGRDGTAFGQVALER
jgi:hypothetical protein